MLVSELSFILIVIGVLAMFLGVILIILGLIGSSDSRVEGGGVIIIGPIPIVFGSTQKISIILLVLAIVLTLLLFLIYSYTWFK